MFLIMVVQEHYLYWMIKSEKKVLIFNHASFEKLIYTITSTRSPINLKNINAKCGVF